MLYELILINEIEQRAKIIFLCAGECFFFFFFVFWGFKWIVGS